MTKDAVQRSRWTFYEVVKFRTFKSGQYTNPRGAEMLKTIKSFFKEAIAIEKEAQTAAGSLDSKLQTATCAILLEMAHADNEFTEDEKSQIMGSVKKYFNLNKEATDTLLLLAEKERKESIDLWQFGQLIKNNYSVDQKINVIEMIWKVIYVDGNLDKHEDYLVHMLAKLLGLNHKQLIDAKMKIKKTC